MAMRKGFAIFSTYVFDLFKIRIFNLIRTCPHPIYNSFGLKNNSNFPHFDYWAESFGAFTYNYTEKDVIVNYIKIRRNIIKPLVLKKNSETY